MDKNAALLQRSKVEQFRRKHRIGLLTLLFTDIVGSTKIKQDLGDHKAVELIQRHHQKVRDVLASFTEGEEIETAGDSFFIVFTKPSDAVRFSLMLQSQLRQLAKETGHPVYDRIGIHVGEVFIEEKAGETHDLFGIQVDTCARVMSLGHADQILMSRFAFDNARQVLKGHDLEGLLPLSWLNHGPYMAKGVEEPIEICEVGEQGKAVLVPPSDSEKAKRFMTADAEPVLGWRPAIGQLVPYTNWLLEKKLGEGGFGEVWLGLNTALKDRRVFKFCFRADRVRSLKREVTLFKLLKEKVGEHPNIVGIRDVFFDEPPYYLIMDYAEGKDLRTWSEERGGVGSVPVETKLEIIAQVADGLQAAHESGIIHRDIKPSNILVISQRSEDGGRKTEDRGQRSEVGGQWSKGSEPLATLHLPLLVKLTDFGVGQVVSLEILSGMTQLGFSQTLIGSDSGSQTGTQLYMAPELLAGAKATIRSDIYSLGVVLYQLLVGDFKRPVTTDWTKDITDPLLREDLEHCFAGKPEERFGAVAQLAKSLRNWSERQKQLAQQQLEILAREKAAYRRGLLRAAAAAVAVVIAFALLAIYAFNNAAQAKKQKKIAESQKKEAELQELEARKVAYASDVNLAQQTLAMNNLGRARSLLSRYLPQPGKNDFRGYEWRYLWNQCQGDNLATLRGHSNSVLAVTFSPDGKTVASGGMDGTIIFWDLATQRPAFSLVTSNEVLSLAYSPDGSILAAGGSKYVSIWDMATRGLVTRLAEPSSRIAFSPLGRLLAIGSMGDRYFGSSGGTVSLWDVKTQRKLSTLANSGSRVSFSADGCMLATGNWNGSVKFWDVASGQLIKSLDKIGNTYGITLSPDVQWLVTCNGWDEVGIWNVATGNSLKSSTNHTRGASGAVFLPDGKYIASCNREQSILVQEFPTLQVINRLRGHENEVNALAISPNGRLLASGGNDDMVMLWNMERKPEPFRINGLAKERWVRQPIFSPNGSLVAAVADQWQNNSASPERRDGATAILVWDILHSQRIAVLHGKMFPLAFSGDGHTLICLDESSIPYTLTHWDIATQTARTGARLQSANNVVFSFRMSPDLRYVVSGNAVWESHSGKLLFTLPVFARDAVFSPDSRTLAACGGLTIGFWDVPTGRELGFARGHRDDVYTLAYSPDGKYLASGGIDAIAKLWDAITLREITSFIGHKMGVIRVAFSPDARTLATLSDDTTIKLWNLATSREVATIPLSPDGWSLAFSPNGESLAEMGSDGILHFWRAPMDPTGESNTHTLLSLMRAPPISPLLERLPDGLTKARQAWIYSRYFKDDSEAQSKAMLLSLEAIGMCPQEPDAWVARSEVLSQNGNGEAALEAVDKALKLETNAPVIWVIKGRLLAATNRWQEAVQAYTKAIDLTARDTNGFNAFRKKAFEGRAEVYRGFGETNKAIADTLASKGILSRGSATPSNLLDLSAYYYSALQETWYNTNDVGNNLELLPQGVQELNGVRYDVRGIIQLAGLDIISTNLGYPKSVTGIPIRQTAAKLQFLHGAVMGDADGTLIAHYQVHYVDGSTLDAPILYGRDIRNWQFWPQMPEIEKTGGTIAWKGTQKRWQQYPGYGVRLYQMTWTNPHPEKEIATIDFVSAMQQTAPFLIAITAEQLRN